MTPSKINSVKSGWTTIIAVLKAMRQNKVTALIPLVIVVLFAAIGLAVINLATPIAPFVYSLF